jgi:hypothetical protein
MGSAAIASSVAHFTFWVLIVWGLAARELSVTAGLAFAVLWFLLPYGLGYVSYGPGFFPSVIAVLDIVLVFIIFKGDVRIA